MLLVDIAENLKVQVYILARNRPEYVVDCVDSALSQTYPNLEVIVSDNSPNRLTEKCLDRFLDQTRFKYIKRFTDYNAYDHFNLCLSESTGKYVMFFHDDDTLLPEIISTMVSVLETNTHVAAVASNANIIDCSGRRTGTFNRSLKSDKQFSNVQDFALMYVSIPMKINPFPSYLYRKEFLNDLRLEYKEGRKHADVSFLMKVALKGKIHWIAKELMNYRVHGKNDSSLFDIKAVLSLARFFKRLKLIPEEFIFTYKAINILIWVKCRLKNKTVLVQSYVSKILQKYALFYMLKNPIKVIKIFVRAKLL